MSRSARHVARRRRRLIPVLLVATGILVLLLAGAAYAGYRYDRATVTRVLPCAPREGSDLCRATRSQPPTTGGPSAGSSGGGPARWRPRLMTPASTTATAI